jgi:Fe-coproporphyrin III synthase
MSLLHEPVAALEANFDSTLQTLPILILNVHSHCNCRCLMCDIWKRTKHEQVNPADMERHRQSLLALQVRQVVLSGGEPLLHSDLGTLCSFFRELGIKLTLLTTGLLLLKRATDVVQNFDEVIVSIDGPGELHDKIRRVPGAFALIAKGIAAVRALRPSMRITCRTTVQKANHDQLRATAYSAREIGFDAISFLAADLTSEAFNRPLVWPGERQNEIALTESQINNLQSEIEALAKINAELSTSFVVESREKLLRILRHFRVHLNLASPVAPVCNAPWVSAVIETDGSVRPCFFHRPVGNITSSTLQEAVNGNDARSFRKALDVQRDPVCRRCVCSLNYAQ